MKPQDKINSFFGSLGGAIPPSAEKPKKSVGNEFQNVNEDFEKASSLAHRLTRNAEEQHEHEGAHHAHNSAAWLGMGHPDKERVEEHKELAHHHADRAKEKYEEEMSKE
jgi:hypothetical protein